MRCPRCGLINPDTALRCDCGYDFKSHSMKKSFSKDSWHYHQDPISLFDFVAVPIQVLIESLQINRKKDSLTEAEYEKLDTELIAKYRERYQSLNDSSLVELFLLHAPDHKPEALAAMTLELDSRKILKPEPSQSTDTNSRPAYPVLSTKWYWACAKLGAVKIVAGIDEYSAWSTEMVRDYSETLRPHLQIIWHAAHRLAGMAKSIQREDMVLACQIDAYNELQEAKESGLVPSVLVNSNGTTRVEIVQQKSSWQSSIGKLFNLTDEQGSRHSQPQAEMNTQKISERSSKTLTNVLFVESKMRINPLSFIKSKIWIFTSFFLLFFLLLIFLFIWPTLWRYDTTRDEHAATTTFRTNRFSGKVQQLTPSGWIDLDQIIETNKQIAEAQAKTDQLLRTPFEIKQLFIENLIQGQGGFVNRTLWKASIYNGTHFTIKSLTINLKTKNYDQLYSLDVTIPSYSSREISITVYSGLYDDTGGNNPDWAISSAYGTHGD